MGVFTFELLWRTFFWLWQQRYLICGRSKTSNKKDEVFINWTSSPVDKLHGFLSKTQKSRQISFNFYFWQNEKAVLPSPPPKYINLSGIHGYQSIITLHFRGCLTSNFMLFVVAQYEYVTNKTSFELKRSLIWSYKFFCLSAQDALSREFLAIQFMRNH